MPRFRDVRCKIFSTANSRSRDKACSRCKCVVGQKRPIGPKHVWAIRVRLEIAGNHRDLAPFSLAIDSRLRGCHLVKLKVADVSASGQVKEGASIIQGKIQQSVRFAITEATRKSLTRWMEEPLTIGAEYRWSG